MAGYVSVMLGWSWTDLSVLGSQLFGQASAESGGKASTGEQTWTFIPFMMCDENITVPKRAGYPHFDWPSAVAGAATVRHFPNSVQK